MNIHKFLSGSGIIRQKRMFKCHDIRFLHSFFSSKFALNFFFVNLFAFAVDSTETEFSLT